MNIFFNLVTHTHTNTHIYIYIYIYIFIFIYIYIYVLLNYNNIHMYNIELLYIYIYIYDVPSISFQTFLERHLKLLLTLEHSVCYCYTSYEMTDQSL